MLNIIVVEDEAPMRDWIVYNISKISDDYKVLSSANNGKEGFELIKDLKPEVIISDIKMPIMDGIELTKKVKEIMPNVYVVLLSNYAEFNYAKQAISCGVFEYLIKSDIRPKELKDVFSKIEKDIISKKELFINKENKNNEIKYDENKYSKSILMALKYIDLNYKDTICLADISKNVFLSQEYFSRLFKEEVGENFSTYLTNYRLNKAEQLLKNSDMKVGEIALEVGYQNPSYFSKTYKKYKGISPDDDRF